MRVENAFRLILVLAILLGAVFGVRKIVLGDARSIKLSSAPALSGQVAQTLGPGPNGSLPVVGQDYTLNAKYFNNGGWAVVNIKPTGNTFQAGFAVMKKTDGIYQVVIGPGTSIASTQLTGLPADVTFYLLKNTPVYNPIPGQ